MVRGRRLFVWLIVVVGVWCSGCGLPPGYIPSVVTGELSFLRSMVPIEAGLSDPVLTDEERDKLAFMLRARDYAEDVIGLKAGNNFEQFVYLGDGELAWNLSASRRDVFEPFEWRVPIFGSLPYLGFFDLDQAKAERDRLIDRDYDTFMYEIDAYALPWLPDPVTSRALRRSYGSIANLVMHELTHNTVNSLDNVTFSESLAVFVGREAGMAFLESEFGPDSAIIQEALDANEDEGRFNTFLRDLYDELTELYESDLTTDEILVAREDVFQSARDRFAAEVLPLMHNQEGYEGYSIFPFNNAFLLVSVRYHSDQEVFEQVFELTGRDWEEALAVFSDAADEDDPVQFLVDFIDQNQIEP